MDIPIFGLTTVTLTAWKVIGWTGALCFASRWLVQAMHRERTGSAQMPTIFWVLSIYFVFGKNDSVGIIQNALPLGVAGYNLWKDLCQKREA